MIASAHMSSASAEMIQVGALSVRFLVEAADLNGSASVFECFVPADSKMPVPHSHDSFEETIYGLEGVTTWSVDGRTSDIRLAKPSAYPAAQSTDSTTTGARMPFPRWPAPAL